MKNCFFILLLVIPIYSYHSRLDSLVIQSQSSKMEATKVPGFMTTQRMPLIPLMPPESLFKNIETETTTIQPLGNFVTLHEYDKDIKKIDERITKIEESITKATTVLENLQDQADSHRKNLDLVVKIMEGIVAILGALTTLIIALKKKKRG